MNEYFTRVMSLSLKLFTKFSVAT